MSKKKFEAVFFDLDGTLINSLPTLYDVYLQFLDNHGCKGSIEEFNELSSTPVTEVVNILKHRYQLNSNEQDLTEQYKSLASFIYTKSAVPNLGAQALLDYIVKQKIRAGVVTSSSRIFAASTLKNHGWFDIFEHIVTADDVIRYKPEPEPYLKALSLFNLEPKSALVVEDSPHGVKSASQAGISVAWICSTSNISNNIEIILPLGADFMIQRLDDLLNIV